MATINNDTITVADEEVLLICVDKEEEEEKEKKEERTMMDTNLATVYFDYDVQVYKENLSVWEVLAIQEGIEYVGSEALKIIKDKLNFLRGYTLAIDSNNERLSALIERLKRELELRSLLSHGKKYEFKIAETIDFFDIIIMEEGRELATWPITVYCEEWFRDVYRPHYYDLKEGQVWDNGELRFQILACANNLVSIYMWNLQTGDKMNIPEHYWYDQVENIIMAGGYEQD